MIIGVTSWQIPGTYLENVKLIHKDLDFIELLVYTWDKNTKELLDTELQEIDGLTRISVHLPTDSLDNIDRAIDYFADKNIYRLTMHPFDTVMKMRTVLAKGFGNFGNRFCLENLENALFYELYTEIKDIPFSVTMDYGHLMLRGKSPEEFIDNYGTRINEIHYHGLNGEKDHTKPGDEQIEVFCELYRKNFKDRDIPVCVELFNWEETSKVIGELRKNV